MRHVTRRILHRLALFIAVVFVFECVNTGHNVANTAIIVPQTKYMFDADYYAAMNPDIAAIYGTDFDSLLKHYVTRGKWEGRTPYENAVAFNPTVSDNVEESQIGTATDSLVQANPTGDIYKALFIGNSITLHPACSYWWGAWGMAASSADKDYVHQTVKGLQTMYPLVDYDVVGFSTWERNNVRSKILPNLDTTLSKDYDLVVIQVGENIKSMKHFKEDYETLVSYIKNSVPTAQVVLVGDFWRMSGRDNIKKSVAEELGLDYIDLSAIRNNSSYISYIGAKVTGSDGRTHKVNDSAVAIHPNDKTMEYIANGIIDAVNNENLQIIVDEY